MKFNIMLNLSIAFVVLIFFVISYYYIKLSTYIYYFNISTNYMWFYYSVKDLVKFQFLMFPYTICCFITFTDICVICYNPPLQHNTITVDYQTTILQQLLQNNFFLS